MILILFHKTNSDVIVQGYCDPRFESVRDIFQKHFNEKKEIGAAVCFTLDGEKVVNLWGGYSNTKEKKEWTEDSLALVFSTTKGLASLCIHLLADRGLLSYTDPVAKYWPEFAQEGKENITIECVLGHRSGLIGPSKKIELPNNEYDWDFICDAIAKSKPWWTPGEKQGYHMSTYGYIVGEIVRRVTHLTIGQFLAQEIAQPLNAQAYIGVPPSKLDQCSYLYNEPKQMGDLMGSFMNSLLSKKMEFKSLSDSPYAPIIIGALYIPSLPLNSDEWKQVEAPSGNGYMSASGLATIYAVLANGGTLGGVHLISPETIAAMYECQSKENELDLCLSMGGKGTPVKWGRGFKLNTITENGVSYDTFGHGGAGGSYGFADPQNHISYGYVTNNYNAGTSCTDGTDARSTSLVKEFYECLTKHPLKQCSDQWHN